MTGDGLHIGFVVESEGSITARGRSIGADAGQVWMPGKEMDLIMGGANLTLDLAVERDLVEQLGWQFQGDPIRRVSQSHLARLLRSCRRATKAARGLPERPAAGVDVELWRDQVLDQLEPVLEPWLVASDEVASSLISATPNYALVRRADAYIEGFGFDAPFQIDLLAETLGVPRRALFHAYRQVLGIGPRQYFELRRLHRFRARLRQAGSCSATVTSIATELGFSDLGRLAGSYRRQFGENPSDTLKLVRRSDGR